MTEEMEAGQGGVPEVAIVGMAGRFPGADDLATFWSNLRAGVESVTFFSDEELLAAGTPPELLAHPDFVRGIARLSDVEHFDAGFFGYSPREAEVMEPGHRLFLECAWEAMEDAGYDPSRVEGTVGVFAGAGASHYVDHHVRGNPELAATVGEFQLTVGSGKDFIATRVSYKLDLRGPSLAVQTGCSTSLVAVHQAVQALLHGECDMALAGGVAVNTPQTTGYLYAHGSILSPDGHCRAFDEKSAGATGGSGLGAVVLKRLDDALRDGDTIRAVIKGSAVNNDGSVKVAYTAPSVEGQSAVISEALAVADVDPDTVTYVEAHGTGTELGDPIEIAALTRAYRQSTDRVGYCTVGSVKTNIGHLDTAAGVAGLVKTVLALENRELPPTVHFTKPNPRIDFASSPFVVRGDLRPWDVPAGTPRRAGVSSFGIGGTNAHLVLEEAPAAEPSGPSRPWQLLPVSARSAAAAERAAVRLADHLRAHPELPLADVAHTLQNGRRAFAHRRFVVAHQGEDAAAALTAPDRAVSGVAEGGHRSVAFLLPGVGDQYVNMGRGLYEREPVFRAEVDRCAEILRPHLGLDLREVLYPGEAPAEPEGPAKGFDMRRMLGRDAGPDEGAERLNRTELAQPAVFVVSYALAKLWSSLGVEPEAVIGHSLGEYTAACLAGVLSLEDALALVADRAKMIQALPGGAMLAVSVSPDVVAPFLTPDVSVATVNAPSLCVVAGPDDAVAALEERLAAAGHVARRLPATHAFHSPMMEPVVERYVERVRRVRLHAPTIPFVSNLTGTWITAEQATDPRYWGRHLRETVRFDEGVAALLAEPSRVLLEVGPGQTLSTFVRQRGGDADGVPVVPSLRYPYDRTADQAFFLGALGRLWSVGVTPDWQALSGDERRRRVPLPTYPWERQRYWVEAPKAGAHAPAAFRGKRTDPAEWTYVPAWRRAASLAGDVDAGAAWLVMTDGGPLASAAIEGLRAAGVTPAVVRAGQTFTPESEHAYVARPAARDDHRQLVEALHAGDRPVHVLHFWSLDGDGREQSRGYASLMLLADALRHAAPGSRLVAVTRGVADVTGAEALRPAAATLLAGCRNVPQEYPNLAFRVVDVESADTSLAAAVLAEASAAEGASLAAYRGRRRWLPGVEAVRPSAVTPVKDGGVYLFTHPLTSRNQALAERLGRGGAKLAFLDRFIPARGAWDAAVEARLPGDEVREGIELIRRLEAEGCEVLLSPARVFIRPELDEVLADVARRWGRIDGVFHATNVAKIFEFAAIGETSASQWDEHVSTILSELETLDAALEGHDVGFVALESSLAAAVGGIGLARVAAAHHLTDAWAQARARRGGTPWSAIAWDRFGHAGDGMGDLFLDRADTVRALDGVLSLAAREPLVHVSSADLALRIADAAAPQRAEPAAGTTYARPELGIDYVAPSTETEERMAEMWQELLGIERIGVHDDFFGLGGHSLLATQIVSRVREMFQLELPLKAIFEAPTVAKFSLLVEEAIIAELESLTEEEALQLL